MQVQFSLRRVNCKLRAINCTKGHFFSVWAGTAPAGLSDKLKLLNPLDMILDTSVFIPKTLMGRRSFSYLGPRYWNGLPRDIRVLASLTEFQALLKHYLFEHFSTFITRCNPYTIQHISFSQ